MKAEILCIGTELLLGDILNTNAKYISKKLREIGIDLYYQSVVGDNFERLKKSLDIAFDRVDLIITTGGLGPTVDDITKEVIADYFDENLIVVDDYYNAILKKYSEKGFTISSGAKKEASILKNSTLLKNYKGLAPGFFYEKNNKKIIVLPGVPKELEWMVDNELEKVLTEYSDSILLTKSIEIKNIPEGVLDDKLNKYFKMKNPSIAPYIKEKFVEIKVAIKGKRSELKILENKLDKLILEIKTIIEDIKKEI